MGTDTKEKVLLNYKNNIVYNNDDTNVIGATTSTTLRTLDTVSGDVAYVRKFGTDYLITDVTDIEDPVDVNMIFRVYAENGTLMGSRQGGGAFVDGAVVTAQGCYMEIEANGGNVTVLAGITIDTDVDVGGLAFVCATETIQNGDTLTLYLSDTASTYYDSNMMYGGDRHTPVLGNARKPYFDIATAYAALNSANDGVEVLDSETYDEELTFDRATTFVQATLGQTPTITSGIGARVSREISAQWNNTTAVYWNGTGNDANSGTWQEPFETPAAAIAGRGALQVIYGGTGAIQSETISLIVALTISAAFTFESDYGYVPIIFNAAGMGTTVIQTDGIIRGFNFNNNNTGVCIFDETNAITAIEQYDCTFINAISGVGLEFVGQTKDLICHRCLFYNISSAGIIFGDIITTSDVQKCIFYNITGSTTIDSVNVAGGILVTDPGQAINLTVQNCKFYDCTNGISYVKTLIASNWILTGTIGNNTFYNITQYGLYIGRTTAACTSMPTVLNAIFHTCIDHGMFSHSCAIVITYCNFYNNGTDYNGTVTSNNEIAGDPKLCKLIAPYKLGLSADSPCFRANVGGDDIGAILRSIIVAEDDITINGFNKDGQSQYNNAVVLVDTDDDTGAILKWCSIYDYQGIAIDLYDDDTDTDAQILNCKIYDNGNGIKFTRGGNIVQECLIYGNAVFGINANFTTYTINHNVFFNNQYGIYFESSSGGIILKNSIFSGNSVYGIFSEIPVTIAYCIITDAINSNVDDTDTSNLSDSPLFINTDSGDEDFHIKTIEGGYRIDSPAKDSADDDDDIGAYTVDRSVANNDWRKYELEFHPKNVNFNLDAKGYITFEDGLGGYDNWAKGHKRIFKFNYSQGVISSETLRQKLEYFITLIKTRENELVDGQTIFRLHFKPDNYLLSGLAGVVDATAKTLTEAQTLIEDQFKGFHIGITYTSGAATGTITAGTRTLNVAPSPVWTVDEWIGYYFHYNGYYYYILDNDADDLILSDPEGTLSDVANINWNIEKYFKIEKHTDDGVFTLNDDDAELVAGTYSWYIDFIECKVKSTQFAYSQQTFNYDNEYSKGNYVIMWEEK